MSVANRRRVGLDRVAALVVFAGLVMACDTLGGASADAPAVVPPDVVSGDDFDAGQAMEHLEQLVALGPRVMGGEGAAAARSYVRAHLEGLGLEVEERTGEVDLSDSDPVDLVNLSVLIPGTAADAVGELAVATPLDTALAESFELLGANEGGSGSALLLELARALNQAPLAYPTRLIFLDGEVFEAGQHLGIQLAATDLFEHDARLLVYVHQVGDADLEIRRDLVSHRVFRDSFFHTAARLGHSASFPTQAGFDQVPGGHQLLFRHGFRQVVALSDIRYGGSEPPGDFWRTAEDNLDHVSKESLAIAGEVVLEGLRDIAAHLQRVDAHSQRPVPEVQEADGPEAEGSEPEAPEETQPENIDGTGSPREDSAEGEPRPGSAVVESPGDLSPTE